jgi:predicted DNA-binding transcriptional regulator AlpA
MRRTDIYALIGEGRFPPPVKLGGASAWVDLEITLWIEDLMASRDARSSGQGRRTNARQTGNSIA